MKEAFENILKATAELPESKRNFIMKNIKEIYNQITAETKRANQTYSKLTGLPTAKNFTDYHLKAFELLKVFGFTEYSFDEVYPDFLEWFIDETTKNPKFNPKLMNLYLFDAMQVSFLMLYSIEGNTPTFNEVKINMLTFNDKIEQYEKDSKRSLKQLLNDINGNN